MVSWPLYARVAIGLGIPSDAAQLCFRTAVAITVLRGVVEASTGCLVVGFPALAASLVVACMAMALIPTPRLRKSRIRVEPKRATGVFVLPSTRDRSDAA